MLRQILVLIKTTTALLTYYKMTTKKSVTNHVQRLIQQNMHSQHLMAHSAIQVLNVQNTDCLLITNKTNALIHALVAIIVLMKRALLYVQTNVRITTQPKL